MTAGPISTAYVEIRPRFTTFEGDLAHGIKAGADEAEGKSGGALAGLERGFTEAAARIKSAFTRSGRETADSVRANFDSAGSRLKPWVVRAPDLRTANFATQAAAVEDASRKAGAVVTHEFRSAGAEEGHSIEAGSNRAKAGIEGVEHQAKESGGLIRDHLTGIGAAVAGVFALRALSSTLRDAAGAAQENARVQKLTAAQIKATGDASHVSAAQIDEQSTAISDQTGVDRETIHNAANRLLIFQQVQNQVGAGNDIFTRATQSSTDLAAVMGGDAAGAAKQLGRALADPTKGLALLSRSGITFTDAQKKQIAAMVAGGTVTAAQAKATAKSAASQQAAVAAVTKAEQHLADVQAGLGVGAAKALAAAQDGTARAEQRLADLRALQSQKTKLTVSDQIALRNATDAVTAAKAREAAAGQGNLSGAIALRNATDAVAAAKAKEAAAHGQAGGAGATAAGGLLGAQKIILDAVNAKVGGAAQAAADPMAALSTSIKNLKVDLGTALLPAVKSIATAFGQIAPAIGPVLGALGGVVATALSAIAPAVKALAGPLSAVLLVLASTFGPLLSGFGTAFAKVASAVLGALAPILASLSGLVPPILAVVNAVAGPFISVIGALAGPVGKLVGLLAGGLVAALKVLAPIIAKVASLFAGYLATVFPLVAKAFESVLRALAPLLPVLGAALMKILSALAPVLPAIARAIGSLAVVMAQVLIGLVPLLPPLLSLATILITKIGVKTISGLVTAFAFMARTLLAFKPVLQGLVIAFVAWKTAQVASNVVTALTTGLTVALSGAVGALNAVMDANPIVLVALALAAIGLAIYEAYKHFEPFRAAVDFIGRALKTVWRDVLLPVVDFFEHHWKAALEIAVGVIAPFLAIPILIITHWHQVVDFFVGLPGEIVGALSSLVSTITGIFTGAFSFLASALPAAAKAVFDFFTGLPAKLLAGLGDLGGLLGRFFAKVFSLLVDAVKFGIHLLYLEYVKLPELAVSAIADLAPKIVGALGSAFKAVVGAVPAFIATVVSAIGQLPGKLLGLGGDMVNAGAGLIGAFLHGLATFGSAVVDVGKAILNTIIKGINKIVIDPLKDVSIGLGPFHAHPFGFLPDIPTLGDGGIFTRPTLAIVGDSTGDAVLPLNKPERARALAERVAGLGATGTEGTTVNYWSIASDTPKATAVEILRQQNADRWRKRGR